MRGEESVKGDMTGRSLMGEDLFLGEEFGGIDWSVILGCGIFF
jgi:hypothetical protein